MRDPNGNVDAFLNQVDHAIHKQDIGSDFGMTQQEIIQDRRKMTSAEQYGSRH
jgi:hypothetical protein